MAKRTLNRRELRKDVEQAEKKMAAKGEGETTTAKKSTKKKEKGPAAPKVKKPRKKKEPPRLCARWGVFDAGMKQVAIFDYNQRAAADSKAKEMADKKSAVFFVQMVKEPMPEPPPPAE